jgi:MFS family permease
LLAKVALLFAESLASLQAAFGLFQTVGALFSGALMDLYGTRGVFAINFLASAACYGLYYVASSATLLYVAQGLTLFQHGMLAARTYLSVVAESHEQLEMLLPLTGVAYGVGMAIGPATGGYLAEEFGPRVPALMACVGSLVSLVSILLLQPAAKTGDTDQKKSDDPEEKRSDGPEDSQDHAIVKILSKMGSALLDVSASPPLLFLYTVRLVGVFAGALVYRSLPIVAHSQFELGPAGLGALMSFAAGVGATAQVVVMTLVKGLRMSVSGTDKASRPWYAISDTTIVLVSVGIVVTGSLMLSFAHTVPLLYAALGVMVVGPVGAEVVLSARLASLAKDKGFAQSLDMSVGSIIRSILAPTLGGMLAASGGIGLVGQASAALLVVTMVIVAMNSQFLDT